MIIKVAVNRIVGGFTFSREAYEYITGEPYPEEVEYYNEYIFLDDEHLLEALGIKGEDPRMQVRTHPKVIECIEELGDRANGDECTELKVIEVPDGVDFYVDEYAGQEWIAERHRRWF